MRYYDQMLGSLFSEMKFYLRDPEAASTIEMSFDEINHPSGIGPGLHLHVAQMLVDLGLATDIVAACERTGVSIRSEKQSIMGATVEFSDNKLPLSIYTAGILDALLQSHASTLDNVPFKPGEFIDITHLYTNGLAMLKHYFELRYENNLTLGNIDDLAADMRAFQAYYQNVAEKVPPLANGVVSQPLSTPGAEK